MCLRVQDLSPKKKRTTGVVRNYSRWRIVQRLSEWLLPHENNIMPLNRKADVPTTYPLRHLCMFQSKINGCYRLSFVVYIQNTVKQCRLAFLDLLCHACCFVVFVLFPFLVLVLVLQSLLLSQMILCHAHCLLCHAPLTFPCLEGLPLDHVARTNQQNMHPQPSERNHKAYATSAVDVRV
jgi:hypothetical protein